MYLIDEGADGPCLSQKTERVAGCKRGRDVPLRLLSKRPQDQDLQNAPCSRPLLRRSQESLQQ